MTSFQGIKILGCHRMEYVEPLPFILVPGGRSSEGSGCQFDKVEYMDFYVIRTVVVG